MSNPDSDANSDQIPIMQKYFDRPFLWLAVGFVTMAAFYTLWGIYEIVSLPKAPLP